MSAISKDEFDKFCLHHEIELNAAANFTGELLELSQNTLDNVMNVTHAQARESVDKFNALTDDEQDAALPCILAYARLGIHAIQKHLGGKYAK